jgi:hypothetical protein
VVAVDHRGTDPGTASQPPPKAPQLSPSRAARTGTRGTAPTGRRTAGTPGTANR